MQNKFGDTFARIITSTYGDRGILWLAQLPSIIEQCTNQWKLTDLTPYPNLTYGCVLAGMVHDLPIVLKIRCDAEGLQRELAALQAFKGYGCVNVLNYNVPLKALLLERAMPGTMLISLFPDQDKVAIGIASKLIQKLHTAPITKPEQFRTLQQLLPNFDSTLPLPKYILEKASSLKDQLLETANTQVMLHGDIHYDNILKDGDDWCAIDPEGLVGDPIYDTSVCIRDPLESLLRLSQPKKIIQERIATFAHHMNCDPLRVYNWAFVQATASACWSIEDGLDTTSHVAFLTLLHEISDKTIIP
jgi:streptomycin 6-kinase